MSPSASSFPLRYFAYSLRHLSPETLTALQIIQLESNSKSKSQGPSEDAHGSKEGLSIYGLFHHLARTPQGKYRLRQYFLRPSLDLDVINERLDSVGVFLRPINAEPVQNMIKSLKSIRNMRTVLINLRKGVNRSGAKPVGSNVWSCIRWVSLQSAGAISSD